MPVGVPPHKPAGPDPGPQHRLEMCRLAVAGHMRLLVSALEVERPGPSYTVDTLRAIHDGDRDAELTFIVGGDMATTLPQWREPEEVLSLARLAVAEREGAGREEIRQALAPLGAEDRVVFLEMPRIDVSSSDVRERVARGESIRGLVPGLVADYVMGHHLYQDPGGHALPVTASAAAGGRP